MIIGVAFTAGFKKESNNLINYGGGHVISVEFFRVNSEDYQRFHHFDPVFLNLQG